MAVSLVGIHGAAGAGKDTIGKRLEHRQWLLIAFADPLYSALSQITGIPVEVLKDRDFKEKVIPWIGKSPRQMLQTLGGDWGREMVCRDLWIKRAIRRVNENRFAPGIAITDVRYDNEAEAIIAAGGVVWKVVRPGASGLAGDTAQHSSEAGVSPHLISRTLTNCGTIDDLWAAVDSAVSSLHADIL